MVQWCNNCRSNVGVLPGKHDLTICRDCGCELSQHPIEPLKTVALFESLIDFDSGLAEYPGQLANAESTLAPLPEVELHTARYLPSGQFDVAARDIELDERWHAEQLLERIIQLEQTFQIAESLIEQVSIDDIAFSALNEPMNIEPDFAPQTNLTSTDQKSGPTAANPNPNRSPGSIPLVRFDAGHVATPDQIRAYNEHKSRKENSTASGSDREFANLRNSVEFSDKRNESTRHRIDGGHQVEIPMARPIYEEEIHAGLSQRIDSSMVEPTADRSIGTTEARQFTLAAMSTAWIIQLMIGLVVVSNGPLAIWSFWLVAETVGTICLGRIGWQLLAHPVSSSRQVRMVPKPSGLASNRDKRVTRTSQHESNER